MENTPLCYTQLVGQEKAKRFLGRFLATGRMGHGYIFKGPQGVGKGLCARGVAAAINCRDSNQSEACGSCSSCRKFTSDNHPDFIVVRPQKGVIKIARIRELIKELSFPPYESAMRVVVIEDVQTMGREAANALLKTLEEPPPGNLLLLTADSSREILATLTSRCQIIPFSSLSMENSVRVLKQQGVDEQEGRLLAGLSEGSPGRAMTLLQTDMVSIFKEVSAFLSDPLVHGDKDVGRLLRLAEKMALLKDDLNTLLGLFRIWLRDLLRAEKRLSNTQDIGTALKNWSSADLFARLEAIDRAEQQLGRNCNRNLVCEVLLFTLQ